MEPWYKVATPRKEVWEGRSFNPDEFAIHLEQVVSGTAPEDYRDPKQFFARTCFTKALREHVGMVLRRLSGDTANTAPVMTLVTQFGGGKTHTLTTLYHLVRNSREALGYNGVNSLLREAGVNTIPEARVAAFVGNAWDPSEGKETPWIDIARQLAGEEGVRQLGTAAKNTPPGTEALERVFLAAGAPVLILFDEVLNFVNRYRNMADQFHAFIQNLTVATTGTRNGAAVISLPRSQVEMTDWDMQWQEKITKVVRRVAKDLIANDETEIAEVIRRRLFEDIGSERTRQNVAKAYADWCFERRAQLPPEWTAVDTMATEGRAREYLRDRFASCYPFHPATLSVFQRKWQTLPQYQQTRGTLAMLAQWVCLAYTGGLQERRVEPLITLGSAPLDASGFRSIVLGQLGESRLVAAIDADISGRSSHARALDADTDNKGALRNIHRRVGTAIFFESSGGHRGKVAHLPELRFALGEPDVDTTSIDNAALALEDKSYFIRKWGSDGFQISYKPTLKKVVNDRRASLEEETEIRPAIKKLIEDEFKRGANIPVVPFPEDGAAIQDTPKLALVLADPSVEWAGNGRLRQQLSDWTRYRGKSPRLYPASLIWCLKKPGRDLKEAMEMWLAWKKVHQELTDGTLGGEFEPSERAEINTRVKTAGDNAKDEVWGGYRFVVLTDSKEPDGVKIIDLGAGHSSSGETLSGRVITALKSQALLSESVGAGYIERNWPPAFKETSAWPLSSLRQSFVDGSLTRLIDPDSVLRGKIMEFVTKGEFGLASGKKSDGSFDRVWFNGLVGSDEIMFESGVFLLTRAKAQALRAGISESAPAPMSPQPTLFVPTPSADDTRETKPVTPQMPLSDQAAKTIRVTGKVPPEVWNRLGTRILPRLRSGIDLQIGIDFSVSIDSIAARAFEAELRQALTELGLADMVRVE